jgi:hypothetical protein
MLTILISSRFSIRLVILFGIHPDSPINRDDWLKSGFLAPSSRPQRYFPFPAQVATNEHPITVQFTKDNPVRQTRFSL